MEDSGIETTDNEKNGKDGAVSTLQQSYRTQGNGSALLDSDSELSDEEWVPPQRASNSLSRNANSLQPAHESDTQSLVSAGDELTTEAMSSSLLDARQSNLSDIQADSPTATKQPLSSSLIVRPSQSDVKPGRRGQQEASSLLVDVQMDETKQLSTSMFLIKGNRESGSQGFSREQFRSDSDDDIPLSWQRSNRSMRDQLLKDGYNLDLESDNEDLDLIPPKQQYSASTLGGLCSCSGESCILS